MASDAVDLSHGITIVFGTSGFSANIQGVTLPPLTRPVHDVSHQGTTGATAKMLDDLFEVGPLSFEISFNADTDPPIDAAEETVTITVPSGTTWVFTGGMVNYAPSATPHRGPMTAAVDVAVNGSITIDDGSGSAVEI